ncbi:ribosome biogenesis factor YjgA [Allohahella marinimesophila]|uniref:Ribosome biogenesis factor YjgA n=1 Tax=Allohahella marinimesophila TaxID=1054972 RepID=A0ABP7PXR2_9GAMM
MTKEKYQHDPDSEVDAAEQDMLSDDVETVSKSEMKRHMHALQALGERLAAMPDLWPELELPDRLLKALEDFNAIPSREAKRRHLQFIGKQMRNIDYDAVLAAIELRDSGSDYQKNLHHEAEKWRERLLIAGRRSEEQQTMNDLITEFVSANPATEVQVLRQTLRNAVKDLQLNRNRGNTKKLYQLLRDGLARDLQS